MGRHEKLLLKILSGTSDANIPFDGNKAKPYQVKQVRNIIVKYKFGGKNV
jgi:hypothetical protein